MMCRVLIFSVLVLINLVFAQKTDSLLRVAAIEKDPVKKAEVYLKLVTFTAQSDSVKALSYLKKAEELTPKNHKVGQARIQNSWGFYEMPKNPKKGKAHHLKGLEILGNENSAEAQNLRAMLWTNVVADEQRMGNAHEAMKVMMNHAIPESKKAADKSFLANNYLTAAIIFYNDENLDKAVQYAEHAINTANQKGNSAQAKSVAETAQLMSAEIFLKKEDYPNAKRRLDLMQKSLAVNNNPDFHNELLHLQSVYFLYTGNAAESLKKASEGLSLAEKSQNPYHLTRLTFMKSKAQANLGLYSEDSATLKKLLQNRVYVQNHADNLATIYDELWMLEEKQGMFRDAFHYAKKRIAVSDSMKIIGQNEAINEMETKFRTAEKEKQLAVQELEINKKNQYMRIFIITTLVFLGAGVFTYFYFRNKKKLSEQREINLQQKLKEKEQAEQLKVTKAILDGEERERERVAKDLHDGLGGMLAGVKINLSTWSSNHLEEIQYESFHKILNQLDSSVSELRRVARNLMPESLLNFGLEIALKDLCEFYMKDGLTIDFQAINIQKNLPLNLQVNIYRIVQELLNNAVKHSNADNILVQCSQNGEEFYITVEDNGKGITESEMSKVKSLGLKNLQNRVDFLKGKMEIQSIQNEGTTINIEVKTGAVA
jgi:signal transduction histidine kinase